MTDLPASDPEPDSLRLELQQAIGLAQTQASLLVQMAGFFVAADAAILAYGFTQKNSAIFLLASLMPAIMLALYIQLRNSSIPVIFVAVKLEHKLHLSDNPLMETYAKKRMERIFTPAEIHDMKTSREPPVPRIRDWFTKPGVLLICSIFAAQICWFLISLLVFHYRFM